MTQRGIIFCPAETEGCMIWLPANDARRAWFFCLGIISLDADYARKTQFFITSNCCLGAGSHFRIFLGRKPSRFVSSLGRWPWSSGTPQRGPTRALLAHREVRGGTINFLARSLRLLINRTPYLYLDTESLTKHFSVDISTSSLYSTIQLEYVACLLHCELEKSHVSPGATQKNPFDKGGASHLPFFLMAFGDKQPGPPGLHITMGDSRPNGVSSPEAPLMRHFTWIGNGKGK